MVRGPAGLVEAWIPRCVVGMKTHDSGLRSHGLLAFTVYCIQYRAVPQTSYVYSVKTNRQEMSGGEAAISELVQYEVKN